MRTWSTRHFSSSSFRKERSALRFRSRVSGSLRLRMSRSEERFPVFGFVGAVLGLAWTSVTLTIAAVCGRRYGSDSSQARGILGLGLALLSIICG